MQRRHGPALLCAAVLAGAAVHGAGPRDSGRPAEGGVREHVLVRRVHWPVLVEPTRKREDAAAICAALLPEQVEVFEDGVPARITALGPRPLPRLHVLLIDTSPSMLDSGLIDAARRAAAEYVDSLPADEPALLASFEVSLVLGAPASTDRQALREAIDGLETGPNGTALWDALYYLAIYLEPLPGEKIVVLLTDGLDSSSLPEHTAERVADLAAATPNLTVFSIRVGRLAEQGRESARAALHNLARHTGGEFFEIAETSLLDRVYRRIEERLDRRTYVSYVPQPFGEGPKDRKSGSGSRWRDVKVRAAPGVPCKVTGLRAAQRFEGRRDAAIAGASTPARFDLAAPGERISGRVRDLILESGPGYRASVFRDSGRLVGDTRKNAVFDWRDVAVEAPPADVVLAELTSPELLLLYMLERDLPAPDPSRDDAGSRPPFLVHGQTFLELRRELGRALIERRSDYSDWVQGKLALQVDGEIRDLVARAPGADEWTARELRDLRAALLAQASSPEEGIAHAWVSEWLGDVPIRKAALDLELHVIRRLWNSAPGDREAAGLARRVEARWPKLGRWFPPAFEARIVTPLIPACDPRREIIGFYRFLLPWPGAVGPWTEPAPRRPLGLRAAQSLLRREDAASLLRGTEVAALEYADLGLREWRREGCRLEGVTGRPLTRVDLLVVPQGETDGESRLRVSSFFALDPPVGDGEESPPPPGCWHVEALASDSVSASELARRLSDALGGASGGE